MLWIVGKDYDKKRLFLRCSMLLLVLDNCDVQGLNVNQQIIMVFSSSYVGEFMFEYWKVDMLLWLDIVSFCCRIFLS